MDGVWAGSVIQATGRTEFEDGPRKGNQSEAGNGLQRVHTIPEINATIVPGGRVDQVPPEADQGPKILPSYAQSVVLMYSCYCGVRIELAVGSLPYPRLYIRVGNSTGKVW